MNFAFFEGRIVPFADAKISVMTHAFNYGTGVFEGIRGYWSNNKINVLMLGEHYKRLFNSAKIIKIKINYTIDQLIDITIELVKRNGYREDVYIRPIAYKSHERIGLGLTGIDDDLTIYMAPFGEYLDISKGINICTSTWRKIDDNIIPARAKVTGMYVNSSLAKSEALENGFDEAIMLSTDGHVAEGSGENIFIVRDGRLITPPITENTLEGLTRALIIELAKDELGIDTKERTVDRTELFIADELFFTGTGAQISPIRSIDKRVVGLGTIGPITSKLQKIYFDIVKGNNPKYKHLITPVEI